MADGYKLEDLILEIAGRTLERDREAEAFRRFPRIKVPPRPFVNADGEPVIREATEEEMAAARRAHTVTFRPKVRLPRDAFVTEETRDPWAPRRGPVDRVRTVETARDAERIFGSLEAAQCSKCGGWTTEALEGGRCVDCRALGDGADHGM
jgi:hypothetical protein